MRAQLRGANAALMRALRARLGRISDAFEAGSAVPDLVLEDFEEVDWASLTFRGARHWVDVRIEGAVGEMERVRTGLGNWPEDADTLLTGHFLAELRLVETRRESVDDRFVLGMRIEALTVEE